MVKYLQNTLTGLVVGITLGVTFGILIGWVGGPHELVLKDWTLDIARMGVKAGATIGFVASMTNWLVKLKRIDLTVKRRIDQRNASYNIYIMG
jgi:hypothetical protein